jgi:acetyl-CoA acetyltransferase
MHPVHATHSGRTWSALEVVVCSPVRTPVGRFGGALKDVPPQRLAATVITELLKRTGADRVDEVVLGQCYPNGEAPAIGRVAALDAGLPVGATGCRILATLMYEMERRQARYGLETMCIGGGQGPAAVFERVTP